MTFVAALARYCLEMAPAARLVVAAETEPGLGGGHEGRIGRSVRIMAEDALPGPDGTVEITGGVLAVVAGITEIAVTPHYPRNLPRPTLGVAGAALALLVG